MMAPGFLLAVGQGLVRTRAFSVESFNGFPQTNPSCFEGVPLGNKEFVFDVSLDAARNVAEP